MSNNEDKTVKDIETFSKMLTNREKILKISKNRQKCRKTLKKPLIFQQPGKNRQKYRKIFKNDENR